MEYNIYRLVGIKPKSMQLPLKSTFVKKFVEKNGVKVDQGFRRIKYVPGVDTIYAEDIKGDLQPESIWFEDGQIRVRTDDKLKNRILTEHPWYGKRYKLWSQELEDKDNLEVQRLKSKARQLIDDADFDKVRAIALAVFGVEAINWSEERSELRLREFADQQPKQLQDIMAEKNYQSRLLAGLAFVKGIVKENTGKTKVIWADSEGLILKLAKGEKGVNELGRFLAKNTEASIEVLQSISDRLEEFDTDTKKEDVEARNLLKENEELKAKLAKLEKSSKTKTKEVTEAQKLRNEYKEKFQKDVPPNMKNNMTWIKNKLSEED